MLFKGNFLENSREVLENLDKFNKIGFGKDWDVNKPNSSPRNQNCSEKSSQETLAEDHNDENAPKENFVSVLILPFLQVGGC